MIKKVFTWFSIVAFGSMFFFATTAKTDSPTELQILQESYFFLKKRLLVNYLQELNALESNNAVRGEIRKIKAEIKKIPNDSPTPATRPAPVTIAPKPVIKTRSVKTHVNDIEGLAGARNFSKNNIYTFHLLDTGKISTLKFWATGRRSTDSTGNVWLITPSGQRKKIFKWKERHFTKPATEISSYKKITPITEDISDYVRQSGTYKIEFEWTGGIDPLVIYRVELVS